MKNLLRSSAKPLNHFAHFFRVLIWPAFVKVSQKLKFRLTVTTGLQMFRHF